MAVARAGAAPMSNPAVAGAPRPEGMTPLTARVLERGGVSRADLADVFEVTGNVRATINPPRSVNVPMVLFPDFESPATRGNEPQPMRVSVPLRALDLGAMTEEEFGAALRSATLLPPWGVDGGGSTGRVSLIPSTTRGGPTLQLDFDQANMNAVWQLAPFVALTLDSGQTVHVELRANLLVLDEQKHTLAQAKQELAMMEESGSWPADSVANQRDWIKTIEGDPLFGSHVRLDHQQR